MPDAKSLLDSFADGRITFADALKQVDLLLGAREMREEIRAEVESAFARGRLPTQVYQILRSKLDGMESDTDSANVSATEPEDTTNLETPGTAHLSESGTEFGDDATATEATIRDGDRQHAAGSALEKTVIESATEETTRTVASNVSEAHQADPDHASTRVIGAPVPGDSRFKPTGSNWARPDQWSESGTGPIKQGSVINDRFTIESELGKGGMGIVFKARDRRKEEARDADPYVAIKILNEEFRSHPQALISLQREATKAQTLAHPNIVTVYDFDRDGTTVYMTMELMRGQPLSDYIRSFRRGGASPDEAVPIIMKMAEGLAYAHKREIVHSDFKPGNVFLTEDNRVKILDFGIARATQYGGVEGQSRDHFDAGDLGALTPGYASLEMLKGELPDPADDVYALAVTAYQLLTGEHPFGRKSAEEALAGKMTPKPIKALMRREWQAIAKGLALTREERISDAGQFLRKFRGPTKAIKRASAAIVVLATLVAILIVWSLQPPQPPFPFEDLTLEQQEQFEALITGGELELTYPPELRGAFEFFAGAYEIHPRNPKAVAGLEEVANLILETSERISTRAEKQALLNELDDTFFQNEYLKDHKALAKLRKKLLNDAAL